MTYADLVDPVTLEWRLTDGGEADDVVLAGDGDGGLWLCASLASLAREEVWLARARSGGDADESGSRVVLGEGTSDAGAVFRPAVAAGGGEVVAVACTADGGLVGARVTGDRAVTRFRVALDQGTPRQAAMARREGANQVWLAVELLDGRERRVVLGRLDPATGGFAIVVEHGGGATWCRWPALAADPGGDLWWAWCEGPAEQPGRVMIARIDGRARADASGMAPVAVDSAPGDAPALAADGRGGVVIAWHVGGPAEVDAGDPSASLVRSLRAARWDGRGAPSALPPPPPGAGGREPRGEDQGWELPAVCVTGGGDVWLVGRSSHGHHVARFDPASGAWSERLELAPSGWGGRGRRHDLCLHRDQVWLARRIPAGVEVGPCPRPAPAAAGQPGGEISREPVPAPVRRSTRRSRAARRRVLFGDMHQHTAHSDGCGSLEDLWMAARDRRDLDFAAITDHDRFCRRSLGPATWRTMCQLADAFDQPGQFAALPAYEYTGPRYPGPGHKCVYFGDQVPDRVPDKDVDTIFDACRELGGLAIPHHVGWTGGDFSHHDPAVQPVWEICSVHGCYECEGASCGPPPRSDCVLPGQFVRDALDAGLRFGFIGSTDSHGLDWHHGIAPRRNPFSTGLACVLAEEPSRAAVLGALRARRCYATSGARIVVAAEVDGAPMGSELPADAGGTLAVELEGTAPIARVVLVTPAAEDVLEPARSPGAAPAADPSRFAARAALPRPDRAGFYFYLRVEQSDGHCAWSSPFWIG